MKLRAKSYMFFGPVATDLGVVGQFGALERLIRSDTQVALSIPPSSRNVPTCPLPTKTSCGRNSEQ
jgi:hypothetical protein